MYKRGEITDVDDEVQSTCDIIDSISSITKINAQLSAKNESGRKNEKNKKQRQQIEKPVTPPPPPELEPEPEPEIDLDLAPPPAPHPPPSSYDEDEEKINSEPVKVEEKVDEPISRSAVAIAAAEKRKRGRPPKASNSKSSESQKDKSIKASKASSLLNTVGSSEYAGLTRFETLGPCDDDDVTTANNNLNDINIGLGEESNHLSEKSLKVEKTSNDEIVVNLLVGNTGDNDGCSSSKKAKLHMEAILDENSGDDIYEVKLILFLNIGCLSKLGNKPFF